MRKVIKTNVDVAVYSASQIVQVDLPRDGVITRIDAEVQVIPSATLVAVTLAMGLWHVIDTLRIVGGGGTQYVGMGSGKLLGRMIHGFNQMEFPGHPFSGARAVAAPDSPYVSTIFRMHFGSRPRSIFDIDNPFDLSAFIPAHRESSLKLEWGCPANNVMSGSVTISSAVMKLTIYQVLGTEAEIKAEMAAQGVDPTSPMMPLSSTESYNHTGTISDLGKTFDIQAGNYLRRIGVMVSDATGVPVLAMDEITRLGLILTQTAERLIDAEFTTLVNADNCDAIAGLSGEGGATDTYRFAQKGIAILDMRKHWNVEKGMNMLNMKNGDVKLAATINTYAAGDYSNIFYDFLSPLSGSLM